MPVCTQGSPRRCGRVCSFLLIHPISIIDSLTGESIPVVSVPVGPLSSLPVLGLGLGKSIGRRHVSCTHGGYSFRSPCPIPRGIVHTINTKVAHHVNTFATRFGHACLNDTVDNRDSDHIQDHSPLLSEVSFYDVRKWKTRQLARHDNNTHTVFHRRYLD